MCTKCLDLFAPVIINGVGILKGFQGYTVDLRLQHFRKVEIGEPIEFISFSSNKGKNLLHEMHKFQGE